MWPITSLEVGPITKNGTKFSFPLTSNSGDKKTQYSIGISTYEQANDWVVAIENMKYQVNNNVI